VLTRPELDVVASRFDLGPDPVLTGECARGMQGRIWRVRTRGGDWAVKELFRREPESAALVGAGLQEAVARAGVHVPEVVRTLDGDVLLALGDRQVRVYSWVDLLPPDPLLDPVQVGQLLAVLHRVGPPTSGPVHPWYTEPVGETAWADVLCRLEEAANPLSDALAAGHADRVALERLLTPPAGLRLLHLDLWADNVRGTPDGLLSVVDWDNSGPGEPARELALVLYEYCRSEPGRATTLHEAYVTAGGPGRVRRREDFGTVVAQLGHILRLQAEAWLSASSPEARDRAQAGLQEFLDDPLTPRLVDRLVDAVT
jgi:Ser/Thr protein kinase RdoA (MazF antagonist)